jgi:hypothetical protein
VRVGIVTNLNGRGLEKDARLIYPIIGSLGHEVEIIQFDEPCDKEFSLLIFLEVTPHHLIELSGAPPWLIPNPEFLREDGIKLVKRHFGKVLCKTHEAHRICSSLFGEMARYVGFMSEDRFDPTVERKPRFLHIAGNSKVKGTLPVLDAFRWTHCGERLAAELVIVSDWLESKDVPEGVKVLSKISDPELRRLQNECLFHLQPSQVEGWSHVLHEALSVNANILTVDFPPMNEIKYAYRVPATSSSSLHSARTCESSALDIHVMIDVLTEDGETNQKFGHTGLPREEFLAEKEAFEAALTAEFQDIPSKRQPRKKSRDVLDIAFLGNFAEHSTEQMIHYALTEGLGHQVEKLQENAVRLHDIREAAEFSDLLIWVRTPTFLKVPNEQMEEFLSVLRIPSAGLHLDKFFGIPEREALVGKIPFWKCKYVFTADGSRQDDFRARGVNHFYMSPAASVVYSHPGIPREEYLCDVGFVGARHGYHSEHPFRNQLIDFLESTYGDRFKLIEGLRGHGLNDFYASCKVCVADCFGGGKIPYYTSDRMVETPMRHGFLLSPRIEGMTIPLATFEPENLTDLHKQIEYWLSHEKERLAVKFDCADHVRRHDTWTERLRMVLSTMGFETGWLW